MILKIPCKIGDQVTVTLIRRDAINVVQPIEDGAKCRIYVDNISLPLEAQVRFKLLSEFLGRSYPEGSMKVPDEKKNESQPQVGQREPNA